MTQDSQAKQDLFDDVVRALSLAVDFDEGIKLNHAWRTAVLARQLAMHVGVAEPGTVYLAGLLHDVGGIGLPDHVVHSVARGVLSGPIRAHPAEGVRVLAPFAHFRSVLPLIAHHHERHDGTGYPAGVSGDDVPREAALLSVADVLDVSLRELGPERRVEVGLDVLRRGSGTSWHPEVARAATELLEAQPALLAAVFDDATLTRMVRETGCTPPGLEETPLPKLLGQLLWVLARLIDAKHKGTMGHTVRTTFYAHRIARGLGLADQEMGDVLWAGLLHDVGTVGVPRRVLDGRGEVAPADWALFTLHASDTLEVVSSIRALAHLALPAAAHHERYDGGGYPLGRRGEEIPLIGRVLAYADTYDLLSTGRMGRRPVSPHDALTRMYRMVGAHLDPHLADVAMEELRRCADSGAALEHDFREFAQAFESDEADPQRLARVSLRPRANRRALPRGAVLLDAEPFGLVSVETSLRIRDGGRWLAKLVPESTGASLLDFLDPQDHNDVRLLASSLGERQVATRYLTCARGTMLEVLFQRAGDGISVFLRSAEGRLRTLQHLSLFYRNFLASDEAVFLTDTSGQVVDANDRLLRMLSRSEEETRGQPAGTLGMPVVDAPDLGELLGRLLAGDLPSWSGELWLRRKDASPVPVHLSASSVRDASGQLAGCIGRAVDITDRKKLESDLEDKNAKLEGLSRFKSDMVAITSHDLKAPLASILGAVDVLRGVVDPSAPPEVAAWLGRIEDTAQKMNALIRDLLDLAKLEWGTLAVEPATLEVGPLLKGCLGFHETAAATRQVSLAWEDGLAGCWMEVDGPRLEQVVHNLLGNALKYSPRGGTVRLEARREPGGDVVLSVDDDGPGIPPADLERVFERYAQSTPAPGGARTTGVSVGLGLHIARQIIQLHGGTIRAENRQPRGCRFVVRLPGARLRPSPTRGRALLAMADPAQADRVAELLGRRSVEVVRAGEPGPRGPRPVVVVADHVDGLVLDGLAGGRGQTTPLLYLGTPPGDAPLPARTHVLEPPVLDVEILAALDQALQEAEAP
jgi:PAS domain S-box-containing protein